MGKVISLDVSFIKKYLKRSLSNIPLEIKLVELYSMNVDDNHNTFKEYKKLAKKYSKTVDDVSLYRVINKRIFVKNAMKIKATIDSMIFLEFGNEVSNAKFIKFTNLKDKIEIDLLIS